MNPKTKQVFHQWLPIALAIVTTTLALPDGTRWMPGASAVIWALIRLWKDDTKIPGVIPEPWRPIVALLLAGVVGVIDSIIQGVTWRVALTRSIVVGIGAVSVHVYGVDWLGDGKDVPLPDFLTKSGPKAPPPTDPYRSESKPQVSVEDAIPITHDKEIPRSNDQKLTIALGLTVFHLITASAFCMVLLNHCGHADETAANLEKANNNRLEQIACVAASKTREESDACRCRVKAKYNDPCIGGQP